MLLESFLHPAVWMITLTYAPEFVPSEGVSRREFQLFLKRLRKFLGDDRLRYFGVGEYGDKTFRPHYHAILYGSDRADMPQAVEACWGKGFVVVKRCSCGAFAYVAQYCTKKMTHADDPRLEGRNPEFALMSRRPGIGQGVAPALAELWSTELGRKEFFEKGGVSTELRVEGQVWPLDRYMRQRIAEVAGLDRSQFDVLTWDWLKLKEGMQKPLLTVEERQKRKRESYIRGEIARRRRVERQSL